MFKNKMAAYIFMGAVCTMLLAQPAFADTAKRIDVDATGDIKELFQVARQTELILRSILALKMDRILMLAIMSILDLKILSKLD